MQLPTTRLPIVNEDLFTGIMHSENDPQKQLNELAISNPNVYRYIAGIIERAGQEYDQQIGSKMGTACLMLYRMLETQAECDELSGG